MTAVVFSSKIQSSPAKQTESNVSCEKHEQNKEDAISNLYLFT